MAPVKRSAEDTVSRPKKSKQLKLDTMITVSPLNKKQEKKGSVIANLTDSQEIVTISSGSSQDSQNSETEGQKPSVTRSVSRTPALVRTSTPKTPALVRTSSHRSFSQLFSQSSVELSFSPDPDSQDSFLSESSDPTNTHFEISKISKDPEKQKQYLVHHLVAQRRLHQLGLEVGPGGYPVHSRGGEVRAEPLSNRHCMDIWICLDTTVEEWKELGRQFDEGWLEASSLLKKFINVKTFPPAAAMHKFLNEGVIQHPQSLVRGEAFSALCYCLQTHPPGNQPHISPPGHNVLVIQVQTTGHCLRPTWR